MRFFPPSAAAVLAGLFLAASASAADLKIALIAGKTGPLEAYAKQTEAGLMLGLEYLTKGTMTWRDRKIVVVTKDDQLKADLSFPSPRRTARSSSSNRPSPMPSRAISGTASSSARHGTRRRTPMRPRPPFQPRARSIWRPWRRTTPSARTASLPSRPRWPRLVRT